MNPDFTAFQQRQRERIERADSERKQHQTGRDVA